MLPLFIRGFTGFCWVPHTDFPFFLYYFTFSWPLWLLWLFEFESVSFLVCVQVQKCSQRLPLGIRYKKLHKDRINESLSTKNILTWTVFVMSMLLVLLFQSSLEQQNGWTSTSRMQTGERLQLFLWYILLIIISLCLFPSSFTLSSFLFISTDIDSFMFVAICKLATVHWHIWGVTPLKHLLQRGFKVIWWFLEQIQFRRSEMRRYRNINWVHITLQI